MKAGSQQEDRIAEEERAVIEKEMARQKAFERRKDPIARNSGFDLKRIGRYFNFSEGSLQKNPAVFILLVLLVLLVWWFA